MARVVFINSILSGKLGGMVFANNKAGEYVRQYRKGTDPATLAQLTNRASFIAASTTWHALTDHQKAEWNTFAITNFKPKFGSSGIRFSGFNAFVSLRNVVLNLNDKINNPSISAPGTITATFNTFHVDPNAPIAPLSSQIKTSTGAPLTLTLGDVVLQGNTGSCSFTMNLIGPSGPGPVATAPSFVDAIGDIPVGIAIVASLPLVQNEMFVANPDINLVAVIPPFDDITTWSATPTLEFTTDPIPGFLDRKLGYSLDQIVQFKAYLVGQNGMTQPLNAVKAIIV